MTFLAGERVLGLLSAIPGIMGERRKVSATITPQDILDVMMSFQRESAELAFGQSLHCRRLRIFVIGGSFGGAAAILGVTR